MPHHDLLSPAQRAQLLALPSTPAEARDRYALTPADLELVARRRGDANRLGFALQLCFLRHPGRAWTPAEEVPPAVLRFVAGQVGVEASDLDDYAGRDQTRREHLAVLLGEYGWRTFGRAEHRGLSAWLTAEARGTDQGAALVTQLVAELRRRRVVVPALPVLERLTPLR